MLWGLFAKLSVTIRVPFLVPLVVGSKKTPMVQFAPGGTALLQLLRVPKSAMLVLTLEIISAVVPFAEGPKCQRIERETLRSKARSSPSSAHQRLTGSRFEGFRTHYR
jgi:hypothetical protein